MQKSSRRHYEDENGKDISPSYRGYSRYGNEDSYDDDSDIDQLLGDELRRRHITKGRKARARVQTSGQYDDLYNHYDDDYDEDSPNDYDDEYDDSIPEDDEESDYRDKRSRYLSYHLFCDRF